MGAVLLQSPVEPVPELAFCVLHVTLFPFWSVHPVGLPVKLVLAGIRKGPLESPVQLLFS